MKNPKPRPRDMVERIDFSKISGVVVKPFGTKEVVVDWYDNYNPKTHSGVERKVEKTSNLALVLRKKIRSVS